MNPQTGYCDDGDTDTGDSDSDIDRLARQAVSTGNNSGDGCDDTCSVETGWTCADGDISNPSVCTQT